MRKYLLSAAAVIAMAGVAHADDSVTVNGITLYGTIDMGVTYLTHGAPANDFLPTAVQYNAYASKNLRTGGMAAMASNGLSQSKLGVKGVEELMGGWSALFKLETGFVPTSGQLDDGPKSVLLNNGKALGQTTAMGDSSRAGQAFQGGAYAGVTNAKYGTLTFGRQNSLLMDNVLKYDPMGGSYAFSILGYTGTFGGAGDTQDGRLDDNLVYVFRYGPMRASAEYKFGNSTDAGGDMYSFGLGADVERLSVDANYVHRKNGMTVGTISSAQLGGTIASNLSALPVSQLPGTLAGTVSDNTAYAVMASYNFGAPKLFAGYERIQWANPSAPYGAGTVDLGYTLGIVNNSAYNTHRDWDLAWTGVKYSVTPALDVTGAYYFINQNNYTGSATTCAAHNTASAACAGKYNAVSLMADYRLSKRFDVYAGAMWSQITGGFQGPTAYGVNNVIDPMVGARFSF